MRKRILTLGMLLLACLGSFAQETGVPQPRLISPERVFFVPHWYVQAEGGLAYDVGESYFSHTISPAVQLAVGYRFSELFGLRGSLSGLWSRNRYAYPETTYKWNFLMPAIDADIDLTRLFFGEDPLRPFRTYAFVGFGLAYSFNNDDAVNASKLTNIFGINSRPFEKLWKSPKWFPALRLGISADYRLTDLLALCGEINTNMLSDRFNSKKGKGDNVDWHFNFMLGVKFNLGRAYGKVDAIYEIPPIIEQKPDVEEKTDIVDVPIDKISFNVNIYFLINQSVIRSNQMAKLNGLVKYLNEHPRAFVRLSGFADKDTGTPTINMRLSRERSQVVSQFLQDVGIDESRIRRFAKGDTVQPFDIPEDNRVCICFVYDPDNPVPQTFEY